MMSIFRTRKCEECGKSTTFSLQKTIVIDNSKYSAITKDGKPIIEYHENCHLKMQIAQKEEEKKALQKELDKYNRINFILLNEYSSAHRKKNLERNQIVMSIDFYMEFLKDIDITTCKMSHLLKKDVTIVSILDYEIIVDSKITGWYLK